jgi:hypothetical protein
MQLAKLILFVTLIGTLSAYALDCLGMMTPEQTMECCKSMACDPHGPSEDCCKAMPAMHSPFIHQTFAQDRPMSHLAFSTPPLRDELLAVRSLATHSASNGASPSDSSPPDPLPLRI